MSKLTDFFWPRLDRFTPEEEAQDREHDAVANAAIVNSGWIESPHLAVEAARRLEDAEDRRIQTAEGKATTYILFSGAFIPILTYLESYVWDAKPGNAPKWISAAIILVSVAYLIRGVVWAFRAVGVGGFHRIDIAELVHAWQGAEPSRRLVRSTLRLARANRHAVNEKVSGVIMAHLFMKRAIVGFGILLIVEAVWQIGSSGHDYFVPSSSVTEQAIAAEAVAAAELATSMRERSLEDFRRCIVRSIKEWGRVDKCACDGASIQCWQDDEISHPQALPLR